MIIYKIHKGDELYVPCYSSGDEALAHAMKLPAIDMFGCWDEVEIISPCWIRFNKGGVDHFIPGFVLTFEAENVQAFLMALMRGVEFVTEFAASLDEPEEGNETALIHVVSAEYGPTCLHK